ncbi:MAG: hydroxymethylbilane synthase, partial [Rhizobacter sp.]|nr:hydroxymethylbilane synthase [Chlorobiales bacterium]
MKQSLVIGTRSSPLALWQAKFVKAELEKNFPHLDVSLRRIKTTGDKILDTPLSQIGDKGLFTREIEKEL